MEIIEIADVKKVFGDSYLPTICWTSKRVFLFLPKKLISRKTSRKLTKWLCWAEIVIKCNDYDCYPLKREWIDQCWCD